MAEENENKVNETARIPEPQKMDNETVVFLNSLGASLVEMFNAVNKVLEKKSCNRSEASIIKAHGVILKSKLTQLHGAKIAD